MLYSEITIGGKDLKLRLDAKGCIGLERKLGKSPLTIFTDSTGNIPKLEELIMVLHCSLQKYQQGYTEDKAYELYDEYVEEGNTFTDFIPLVMDIFKVSGFFKENDIEKAQVDAEKKQMAVVKNSKDA